MQPVPLVPALPSAGILKRGAGLLISCGGEVLLLRRCSVHNNNSWGLPGGNVDAEDGDDLLATAVREGLEELGHLPPKYDVVAKLLTTRGKGTKLYTVFIVRISPGDKAAYVPTLNHEHCEWRWFPMTSLQAVLPPDVQLHPVVSKLLDKHKAPLLAALGQTAE